MIINSKQKIKSDIKKQNTIDLYSFLSSISQIKKLRHTDDKYNQIYCNCLKILSEKNFNHDYQDKYGNNLLHIALKNESFNEALALMQTGVDLGAKNHDGKKPLEIISFDEYKFIFFLVKNTLNEIEEDWHIKTKGFHIHTKEIVLDYFIIKRGLVNNMESFLIQNGMDTLKNKVNFYYKSKSKPYNELYHWAKESIPKDDLAMNTILLFNISKTTPHNFNILNNFFKTRKIGNSDNAYVAMNDLIGMLDAKVTAEKPYLIRSIFSYLDENHIDINHLPKSLYVSTNTIHNKIFDNEKNPLLKSIYLEHIVSKSIPKNQKEPHKKLKI